MTLTGVNTYTGTTTVSNGILNLNSGGVALAGTTAVQITGGTLTLQNSNQINPVASLTVNGSGAVFNLGANLQTLGGVHLLDGSILGTGTLTLNTSNFDMENGTVSGNLAGTAGVLKSTGGTVLLSGSNSYSGGTTINDGTLQMGAVNTMPAGGAVTVNSPEFSISRILANRSATFPEMGRQRLGRQAP